MRVAKVLVGQEAFVRPVTKLYPLDLEHKSRRMEL